MANKLTISLTNRKLEQLHDLYEDVVKHWQPDNQNERLLYDHAKELWQSLKVKIAQEVQRPKIVMSTAEARAMWLLWQTVGMIGENVTMMVAVDELMADVDKYLKQPEQKLLLSGRV